MKKNKALVKCFGSVVLLAVIGLLIAGCPNHTLVEAEILAGFKEGEGKYYYQFQNASQWYEVKIEIGEKNISLPKGKMVRYDSSSKTLPFKYSPANRVKYSVTDGGQVDFEDK